MVGDDQDDRVVVEQLEEAADLVVEVAVIVADRRPVRAVGLVQDVLGVVVLPEAVVDAVEADLDELEVVPVGVRRKCRTTSKCLRLIA